MKFSQRIGKKSVHKQIQLESIDKDLKNCLWNVLNICVFDFLKSYSSYGEKTEYDRLIVSIWLNYFKRPIDTIPYHKSESLGIIRDHFFHGDWYEAYDFLEFLANLKDRTVNYSRNDLIEYSNHMLQQEYSGYRFIGNKIVPISNELELNDIEEVLKATSQLTSSKGANIHLQRAIDKLSDRKNPDYRNSIKESISAVESIAKLISKEHKDTLGKTLSKIRDQIGLHNALEKGFKQIYGYTSDGDGIRHALMENDTCDFEDAKYMLVSCSCFINYLIQKADKMGVSL